jgi:hypothetical protein
MAGKPFDATLKDLIEADAASWAALASSAPPTSVRFEDADVSSVTAAADKVLRVVDSTGEWLLDLEPQSSHAGDAPDALHLYSTLLEHRHGLRVRSVLLLLRREANATMATGILERRHPDEEDPYLVFRYRVIRLWQEPVERFLTGGLGTLPLAALTDEAKDHLSAVVDRIDARLEEEASPALAERLRAGTFLLLGLRYEADQIPETLRRIKLVEESSTYQLIVRRGRIIEARHTLLRQGKNKYGPPADAATQSQIDSITDLDHLEAMTDRIPFVSSWSDLLAET